jgi:hypothetical protein
MRARYAPYALRSRARRDVLQGLVASACKSPQTVSTLRDLLSTLFLYTAERFPALGVELREKNEQLADALRVSG